MSATPQIEPLRDAVPADTIPCRAAESASEEYGSMARRRYQNGTIFVRGKRNPLFIGRYRKDEIQQDGTIKRHQCKVMLGLVSELRTEKNARRVFEPFLAEVNAVDFRPGRVGKLGEFSISWEREVLPQQKPSSVKAAQSHLRTYIRPWLGETRLDELGVQSQQNFVTRLSKCVTRKTALNVLATLGSILRTAKAWGYCCHALDVRRLALPCEEAREQARSFTPDEARRILALAAEPYRTIFAIAVMAGLRAGEVLGLQRSDLDFDRGLIHVRRSAWYGRVQSVKSKSSRAPVAMPAALAEQLREYLKAWKPNPEGFLFLTRNGRPVAANKAVEYGLWPVLDALNIPRAGMHAFRHCHASVLIDVGANPKVAQQQMRHADARITLDRYAHVIGDAQREAVERVGEVLRPDAKFCALVRPN